jgi:hypothetical protein
MHLAVGNANERGDVAAQVERIHPAKYTVDGVWGGWVGYFALLAA